MIRFISTSVRNFMSIGNIPIKLNLDRDHVTAIVGKNGQGKSILIIESIIFAIFGRSFRNINKTQLINSINKKQCVVEVEFVIGNKHYRVVRGLKPNIFEIYCDGQLINQEAATKDYQKILEQQILKVNYKTFTQVVLLGAQAYIPFMQLPALQRREVVENILDIGVFSTMSQLLKERVSVSREKLSTAERNLLIAKSKIDAQKKLVDALSASRQDALAVLQEKIQINNQNILANNQKLQQHQQELQSLNQELDTQQKIIRDLSSHKAEKHSIQAQFKVVQEALHFFNSHDECPSCKQSIDSGHRQGILVQLNSNLANHKQSLENLDSLIKRLNDHLEIENQLVSQIQDKNLDISSCLFSITTLNSDNDKLQQEIKKIQQDSGNLNQEKQLMKALASDAVDLINQKNQILNEQRIQGVAAQLLKDSGIKTTIVREYLPSINKLINHYLNVMDLWVQFEFDESFNESIKARDRDIFTYESFSAGERARIDMALMLVWRQIAKMKNSVNTNLLVMDETIDQGLDSHGVETMRNLFDDLKDTNIFIVSHKPEWADRVNKTLYVRKVNNFSTLEE
mgnify:CR=1 FL=1